MSGPTRPSLGVFTRNPDGSSFSDKDVANAVSTGKPYFLQAKGNQFMLMPTRETPQVRYRARYPGRLGKGLLRLSWLGELGRIRYASIKTAAKYHLVCYEGEDGVLHRMGVAQTPA
jgi:hypothetical protein